MSSEWDDYDSGVELAQDRIDEIAERLAKAEAQLPTPDEREKLASMRDELLQSDWAYWHSDPAILWLNRLLGDEHPPYVPPDL